MFDTKVFKAISVLDIYVIHEDETGSNCLPYLI